MIKGLGEMYSDFGGGIFYRLLSAMFIEGRINHVGVIEKKKEG